MRVKEFIKKFLVLIGAAITLSFATIGTLRAQDGNTEYYLNLIEQHTKGTLDQVNNLPNYLAGLGAFIVSWMTPDTSQSTTQMQGNFATIGSALVADNEAQSDLQPQLTATLFSPAPPAAPLSPASLALPADAQNSILKILPNVNDLAYSTLLGLPPSPKAPNVAQAPYNYIANASGITLLHTMPGQNWQGSLSNQIKYQNYYNTIMAVKSFNAYVLSQQYVEAQNKNPLTTAQMALVAQASNSEWIANIASEELGIVLRQILMFQSQSYVLLTQLIQLQRQALTAQVMTNSLLVAGYQNSESYMASKAQGVSPQG